MTNAPLQRIIDRILAVYARWERETSIETMRRDWEALHAPGRTMPAPTHVSANGVRAAWIGGAGTDPGRAILFFHGGGFQIGSIETHRSLMANIAAGAGCRVLGVEYRLVPEHRFPAPVEDALAAYQWLTAEGFAPERIAVAGDSAGGGLALSLLLALKARAAPLPAAAAVMSPWTDMEARGETYTSRAAADPIHRRSMIVALARAYLGRNGDPRDPLASPIHGNLSGLPPLLIQVGERETVLDDSRMLADRANAAGVEVRLDVWDGMIHVFQLYAADLSEARNAIAQLCSFLRHHLAIPDSATTPPGGAADRFDPARPP